MAAAQSGSKLGQLFRRGMIEVPDVMIGSGLGLTGIVLALYGAYKHNHKLVDRPFKHHYIVMRDDEPKAEKYKKFHENPVY